MCIFVFSDLHGNIPQLKKVVAQIEKEKSYTCNFSGDMGIDTLGYEKDLLFSLKQELTIVRGNIDQPWLFMSNNIRIPLLYTSINFEERIIAITHGDYFHSWQKLPIPLTNKDIFITGHTHIPHLRKLSNQPIELNPGSVSNPRNSHDPSYAVITDKFIQIKSLEKGIQIGTFFEYL